MLDALLVCPVCHQPLAARVCSGCGRAYRGGDRLDLTPLPPPDPQVQERWGLWEALQRNGAIAYEHDPPSSLSVGERPDARAFARFCGLTGLILDVGCGPQRLPSYARGITGTLVGIDPLPGYPVRDFAFVRGIAEFLPFPAETFDRVLFATSIDHLLVPSLALREARRVLRPGGRLCVWLGVPWRPPTFAEAAANALRLARRGDLAGIRRRLGSHPSHPGTPATTAHFDVPPGAVDAFHADHPDPATIGRWLTDAGLAIEATDQSLAGHCFIRARR